ncbi:MAG: PKD domain-containing protein, partial [Candidatus Kapabacteria bacterium]|nr:PKD domain-containing protein [Candidatus Kapabacteria bacterium]
MKKLHLVLFILLFSIAINMVDAKKAISRITSLDSNEAGWIDAGKYKHQNKKIGAILNLKYSQDGKSIFTYSEDKYFRKWDVESGKVDEEKLFNFQNILTLDFTNDGNIAVIYTKDSIFEYSIEKEKILFIFSLTLELKTLIYNLPIKYDCLFSNIIISQNNREVVISKGTQVEYSESFLNPVRYNVGVTKIFDLKNGNVTRDIDSLNVIRSCLFSKNDSLISLSNFRNYYEYSFHSHSSSNYNYSFAAINNIKTELGNSYQSSNTLYFLNYSNNNLIVSSFLPEVNKLVFFNTSNNIKDSSNNLFSILNLMNYNTLRILDTINLDYSGNWLIDYNIKNDILILGSNDGILRIINSSYFNKYNKNLFVNIETNKQITLRDSLIQFNSIIEGNADKYLWDFGDSTYSTIANPSHIYNKKGIFTVKLFVSNDLFKDTIIKNDMIQIFDRNSANFSQDITNGIVPLSVNFKNYSTGDINEYVWDFGDGFKLKGYKDPLHIYKQVGNYTVTLYVSNQLFSSSFSISNLIKIKAPVKAEFNYIIDIIDKYSPVSVTFTNSSQGIPTNFLWDFGDGE